MKGADAGTQKTPRGASFENSEDFGDALRASGDAGERAGERGPLSRGCGAGRVTKGAERVTKYVGGARVF